MVQIYYLIYIPIWFYLYYKQNFSSLAYCKIYIPIWFYLYKEVIPTSKQHKNYLHSNMVLLIFILPSVQYPFLQVFTFQYGSTYIHIRPLLSLCSMMIYIPIWFYLYFFFFFLRYFLFTIYIPIWFYLYRYIVKLLNCKSIYIPIWFYLYYFQLTLLPYVINLHSNMVLLISYMKYKSDCLVTFTFQYGSTYMLKIIS